MTVKDIMKPSIISVTADTTVSKAAKIMNEKNIGSVIISKGGKDVGIMTERDVLKRIVAVDLDPKKTKVQKVMSSPIITIEASSSIDHANEVMLKNTVRRLLVTEQGKVTGIVSARDIANKLRHTIAKKIIEQSEHHRPEYYQHE